MYYLYLICIIIAVIASESVKIDAPESSTYELPILVKNLPPDQQGMGKGNGGRICIIGGSVQYSAAPYFSGISALKAGADIVFVMTPKETSTAVKSYSPDLLVYPYFNTDTITKLTPIIMRSDVIVIGPGLDTEEETFTLTYDIINTCKTFEKPIVIDAGGLLALAKNPTILKDYPGPVVLTPNHSEGENLIRGMALANHSEENWYDYWGRNVSVLLKGETDQFFSSNVAFNWLSSEGGSSRRCPFQGNIVAGSLGTFLNWALKNEVFISNKRYFPYFSQSVASYAAAKLTRYSNSRAFEQYGRSLIASNMVDNIHLAFKDVFET